MGCNSLRFSLEWHRIEPRQGEVDQSAIDRYHAILDCMEKCVRHTNQLVHVLHKR